MTSPVDLLLYCIA